MSDELTKYYKGYYNANGYTMSATRDSSRVKILQEWLRAHVAPGAKILDVGCGDMYLATACPEYSWQGIDINIAKAQAPAVEHDLMTTPYPFPPSSFDAVVCSEVLEHVWDLRVIQREVFRLLKPGGKYLMSTPNYDHMDFFVSHYRPLLFDPDAPHLFEHIRQYNYPTHMRFAQEAGFREITHCGADAHYSGFLAEARKSLLRDLAPHGFDQAKVDVLLGKAFPDFSHTIMILLEKPNAQVR